MTVKHFIRYAVAASIAFISLLACVAQQPDQVPWGIASSASSRKNIFEWYPKMAEAGVSWVRMGPYWGAVEPVKGEWKWDSFDEVVKVADENHLLISAVVMGSHPWTKNASHTFPMAHLDDWAEFISASVGHYKSMVRYWEIWNEGNGGFNGNHNTTADYAELVATSYAAAKKANPDAQIGMTVASFDAPYLLQAAREMAKAGKPDSFDYLCIHPYEVADGISDPDGEIPYLWMTKLLRDALKMSAPARANADIWITEVGHQVRRDRAHATEKDAAEWLVKLYVMAHAQGIKRTMWFEARDPSGEEGGFGLIEREGKPRASYQAMKTMTATLGPTPKYEGWLALGGGGRGYGFVFQTTTKPVLVAWMPAGLNDKSIKFTSEVTVINPLTAESSSLKSGDALAFSNAAVFVADLPAELVAQARENSKKNFPWGGDFANVKNVGAQFGANATNSGVFKRGGKSDGIYTFADGSSGLYVPANRNTSFYVHPSFAGLLTSNYYIRLTLRRITSGNLGMNFNYERADSKGRYAYPGTGVWYSVPEGDGWQTKTWHVTDASFSKMWGYDFAFSPEKSEPFVIGRVEVSTEPF